MKPFQAIWAFWPKGIPSKAEYTLLMVAAFLDAILRTSPDSDVTLFRILFPLFLIFRLPALVALPAFRTAFIITTVAAIYMLLQTVILEYTQDFVVLSYGVLVLTAALFAFLIYSACHYHGTQFVVRLLLFWYILIVLASLLQIYFPYEIPNATYRPGVGRIYFGQENDASAAIAALFPLLLLRMRPAWLGWILFAAGMFVVYENGTRMAILAVALLMLVILASYLASHFARAIRVPIGLVALLGLFVFAAIAFMLRDVPIQFPDHSASLTELVLTPLQEVFAGTVPTEYTSVNVRVTTVIAGLAALVETYGFGVGPGAGRFVVAQHFSPDLVISMHSFPIQMMVELGWLGLAIVAYMLLRFRRQIHWSVYTGVLVFNVAVVSSATSGAVTNYFFLACLAVEFMIFRTSPESGTTRLSWPKYIAGDARVPAGER